MTENRILSEPDRYLIGTVLLDRAMRDAVEAMNILGRCEPQPPQWRKRYWEQFEQLSETSRDIDKFIAEWDQLRRPPVDTKGPARIDAGEPETFGEEKLREAYGVASTKVGDR